MRGCRAGCARTLGGNHTAIAPTNTATAYSLIVIIILINLSATLNADKTKDLFNCHVLHHSKAAGAADLFPNELSPSSPDAGCDGNKVVLHLLSRSVVEGLNPASCGDPNLSDQMHYGLHCRPRRCCVMCHPVSSVCPYSAASQTSLQFPDECTSDRSEPDVPPE